MIEPYHNKVAINLKKANGQLRRVEKMIEEQKYCLDIAQQINAAIGLLKQANSYIMESHMLSCGVEKLKSKDRGERLEFVKRMMQTFSITNR
ncbi:MAG TPA: metal-sensing transcriptional repressor [Patescibacteria group bacterium]|nr:metal-sensing transcriptional repressor [Patescibacteria group bacterium]